MLKVVGIVGYKDSGKTTLAHALARELTGRGYEVAVIKHTSHQLDLPGKDTAILGESVGQVAIISSQESALFWKRPLSLEDIISYLEADVVIVEGFKMEKTFPKIVCLRGERDDGDLFDGLVIAAVGPAKYAAASAPMFERNAAGDLADLVEKKAFKLPNLDCAGCGREICYDLACDIVAGVGQMEDCISLRPATEVKIDGEPLPLNPFISTILRETILGMLSPLKGFKKGEIEIRL